VVGKSENNTISPLDLPTSRKGGNFLLAMLQQRMLVAGYRFCHKNK
jgi:hypothetical protein